MTLATAGPGALWYTTRGAGLVSLLLLTLTLTIGVVMSVRWSSERWPRLILDVLHRNASMIALGVIALHILTAVADSFTPLTLKDAVIPFASKYRPVWVGLGALAFDLLIAVAVTSFARRRLGYRAWRAVHWTAYACWPLAVVHGFGTGSDTRVAWMLITTLVCVAVVLGAVGWRVTRGWPAHVGVRTAAAAAVVVAPLALAFWLASGPLAKGWARRAGTPAALLRPQAAGATRAAATHGLPSSFNAQLSGTISQASSDSGLVSVDLPMTMSGGETGSVEVQLIGQPLDGGGVSMSSGSVTAGPPDAPTLYSGRVTGLQGSRIAAVVSAPGHRPLLLNLNVSADASGQTVNGVVAATPAR